MFHTLTNVGRKKLLHSSTILAINSFFGAHKSILLLQHNFIWYTSQIPQPPKKSLLSSRNFLSLNLRTKIQNMAKMDLKCLISSGGVEGIQNVKGAVYKRKHDHSHKMTTPINHIKYNLCMTHNCAALILCPVGFITFLKLLRGKLYKKGFISSKIMKNFDDLEYFLI